MSRRAIVIALAPPAPPCFETRASWIEYCTSAAEESKGGSLGPIDARTAPARFNLHFDFCSDCLARHALAMLDEGRCVPDHLHRVFAAVDAGA